MIKICCVTYGYLDKLVKTAVEDIKDGDISINVVEGLREEIIDEVQKSIADGVEIVLAGGANSKILEEMVSVPVLGYKLTDFDYLSVIHKGLKVSSKVAMITYKTPISSKLAKYLRDQNIFIENIVYEDSEELEWKVSQSDADVIIGAAYAVEIGQKLSRRTELIYPGIQSIIDTICSAKQMALEIRRIKEQNQYANTVMNYSTNGIVLVDDKEIIVDCNSMAAEIFGEKNKNFRGLSIKSGLSEWDSGHFKNDKNHETSYIIKVNEQDILVKVIKIGENTLSFCGAVIILLKIDEVKKAQLNYAKKKREETIRHGFEARRYFGDIIGGSYAIKSIIEDAKIFAKSNASVLLYGETGVGKELFAQGIHNNSARSEEPFIAINCGALSESLLEAELFGYDEGAFTGSRKGGKKGLFELAEGGTIFLDEIGEISPFMQTKLLRVLQEHEILRVGGDRIIPVDVRVVAATNKDLEHVDADLFRRDLLYRLNVLELLIPPLRERENDVALIFEHFYKQHSKIEAIKGGLPEEVSDIIKSYDWPGNIREMQNVCERFCLYLEQVINPGRRVIKSSIIKAMGEQKLQKSIMQKYEHDGKTINLDLIKELGEKLSYNREKIAKVLGISRTTIWRMTKESEGESSIP